MSCLIHKWHNVDTKSFEYSDARTFLNVGAWLIGSSLLALVGAWLAFSFHGPTKDGMNYITQLLLCLTGLSTAGIGILGLCFGAECGFREFSKHDACDRICTKCEKVDLGLQRQLGKIKAEEAKVAEEKKRIAALSEKCLNYRTVSQSLNSGVFK